MVWLNGFSIDYVLWKFYWLDEMIFVIESVNLDGFDCKMIFLIIGYLFGFDVYNGFVYWIDWIRYELLRVKIIDLFFEVVLRLGLEGVMEIRVYDFKR